MNAIIIFFKKYWIGIAALIIGLIGGYYANVQANNKSDKKIIDAITAQIKALQAKSSFKN